MNYVYIVKPCKKEESEEDLYYYINEISSNVLIELYRTYFGKFITLDTVEILNTEETLKQYGVNPTEYKFGFTRSDNNKTYYGFIHIVDGYTNTIEIEEDDCVFDEKNHDICYFRVIADITDCNSDFDSDLYLSLNDLPKTMESETLEEIKKHFIEKETYIHVNRIFTRSEENNLSTVEFEEFEKPIITYDEVIKYLKENPIEKCYTEEQKKEILRPKNLPLGL
jgi:hypothetical protein